MRTGKQLGKNTGGLDEADKKVQVWQNREEKHDIASE